VPIVPLDEDESNWFSTIKSRLALIGLDSETYTESITLLAKTMAQLDRLEAVIKEQGLIQGVKAHPVARILNQNTLFAHRLLRELGLTFGSIPVNS